MKVMTFWLIWLLMIFLLLLSSTSVSFEFLRACAPARYSIIYEVSGIRDDGAKCYFVLLQPPDLQDDHFKNDIKQVVKEIVGRKGGKITIYFFDNGKLLEEYYQCVMKKVAKSLSKREVRHHIATFSGQYHVGSFYNYIYFFPSLTLTNFDLVIGQYMEWQVFDPLNQDESLPTK